MTGELAIWLLPYLYSLLGMSLAATMALYLWTSRRELSRNEEHKKDMTAQQEKFLLLHIDVMNEKLKSLVTSLSSAEDKSQTADAEIKGMWNKSKENEQVLFKRDEDQYAAMSREKESLNSSISDLRTQLAELKGKADR